MFRSRRLEWALPAVAAWAWFCTLRATAWARVETLSCVENWGFATYVQLVANHARTGVWAQTIHRGYDDAWTWSGHRSLWLWPASWLWEVAPGAFTLAQLQIGLCALGAFPAYALGRAAFGGASIAGGIVGLCAWLGSPPLWAIALNDYQDLVLGAPFVLFAAWAIRAGSTPGFCAAAFAACAAREEWAVVVPLVAFGVGRGARLRWTAWALGVVAVWGGVTTALGGSAYHNPLVSQLTTMRLPPPILRSWADFYGFYRHFLFPLGLGAVFAPIEALAALPALAWHLVQPGNVGVDADWRDHIHHMAPVVGPLAVAQIDGLGAVWRRVRRSPWMDAAALALVLAGTALNARPWLVMLDLRPTVSPALPPVFASRVWELAARIPAGEPVVTDTDASLAVAHRPDAFTFESLDDKTGGRGLAAARWAIVRDDDTRRGALRGETVDTAGGNVLVRLQ